MKNSEIKGCVAGTILNHTMAQLKKAKRCKTCKKVIREQNKSGFCIFHNREKTMTKNRKLRKKEHLCVNCGKDIIPRTVYYIRCDDCIEKYKYKNKSNPKNTKHKYKQKEPSK
jgi:hypothetical protein